MKHHPLSECLPMLPGHELDELAGDIKKHGLKYPIVLFEKKILDGRNRFAACKRAGIKPTFIDLDNGDPVAFVMSMNVARRQLTPSQKAMGIAKLTAATTGWKSVGRPKITATAVISEQQAAESVGVSADTIQRAKEVLAKDPKKANQVIAGKKSVRKAAKEIKEEKAAEGVVVDSLGYPVPKPALPYWNRADEVKAVLHILSKLKTWAEEQNTRRDPLYSEVNMNEFRVDMGNAYHMIKCALPYVVCTSCQGQLPDNCTLCKGRGVISQFRYERALPEETRKMREIAISKLK